MIVVTVGTQLPFDRLVRAVDALAPTLPEPCFAQIGEGGWTPAHMPSAARVAPSEFDAMLEGASVIVSHAGIGTLLMARRLGKPLVVMPRRAAFKEHRDDHQVATVAHLGHLPGIFVAETEGDLAGAIDAAFATRGDAAAATAAPSGQALNRALFAMLSAEDPRHPGFDLA